MRVVLGGFPTVPTPIFDYRAKLFKGQQRALIPTKIRAFFMVAPKRKDFIGVSRKPHNG